MSKKQNLKAREKVVRKMTRDGLVERSAETGEDIRISKREADLDLRGDKPETLSQVGTRRSGKPAKNPQNRRYQSSQPDMRPGASDARRDAPPQFGAKDNTQAAAVDDKHIATGEVQTASETPETPHAEQAPRHDARGAPARPRFKPGQQRPSKSYDSVSAQSGVPVEAKKNLVPKDSGNREAPGQPVSDTPRRDAEPHPPNTPDRPKSAARHTAEPAAAPTQGSEPPKQGAKPQTQDAKPPDKPETQLRSDKPGKLNFSADESAPEISKNKKLQKAERQFTRADAKLDKAKSKLPSKKKLRKATVVDQKTGKPKQKLWFETEVKSQAAHVKGSLVFRPVKAAGSSALMFGHRKMYQVEKENVGTEAAHKGEMAAEGGVRSALRHHKTAPYKKVAKLERKSVKKSINLSYRKALAENPKLKSNPLARAFQKRKIKKDYAKKAREAKKAAERAKKAGSAASSAAKAVAGVVKRHPVATAVILLVVLLIFLLMSLFSTFGGAGSGGFGAIISASYLAEDADIDNAELSYTEWETDLQAQIASAESSYPGYDEYRYNVGDISHNPFELMAYLTAVYQNFPYSAIENDLRALFNEQYSLTFTPTTETRYRTVTSTDPDTGATTTTQEPYDWHVMTVTLTARSFSDVAAARMDSDQLAHYAILMQTKGARQYLANPFGEMNWLPYVTSYYGYRIHPISGVKDLHRGIDIGLPLGTPIQSGQDGTVTFAGNSGNYGNVVVIDDGKGLVSKYAHCNTMSVSVGQSVKIGDVIATVGSTGNSTGPHLHLEILKDGQYLNPIYFCDTGGFNLTPNYGNPGAAMGDGSYAALIAEAELYLNYPYVWGGSSPSTSFDCSGYVSWVLVHSGVKNVGRLGAQGLYNICSPVLPANARPGDLIFFTGTYSAPNPVTHVGIYVGPDATGRPRMLHCGNPIQYTYIDTTYWQNHFYGFGRIQPD